MQARQVHTYCSNGAEIQALLYLMPQDAGVLWLGCEPPPLLGTVRQMSLT